MIIVHNCRSCKMAILNLLNSVVIDNVDLHIFQFNINFVIFGSFLLLYLVTVFNTSGWTLLK